MITHFNIIQIAAVPWNILYFGRRHHRHWNWRNGICHSAACCFLLFFFSSLFLWIFYKRISWNLQNTSNTYLLDRESHLSSDKVITCWFQITCIFYLEFCLHWKKKNTVNHWFALNRLKCIKVTGCFEVNVWLFLRKRQQKFKKKSNSNSASIRMFDAIPIFCICNLQNKTETFLR